jgi:hypothetical protein
VVTHRLNPQVDMQRSIRHKTMGRTLPLQRAQAAQTAVRLHAYPTLSKKYEFGQARNPTNPATHNYSRHAYATPECIFCRDAHVVPVPREDTDHLLSCASRQTRTHAAASLRAELLSMIQPHRTASAAPLHAFPPLGIVTAAILNEHQTAVGHVPPGRDFLPLHEPVNISAIQFGLISPLIPILKSLVIRIKSGTLLGEP